MATERKKGSSFRLYLCSICLAIFYIFLIVRLYNLQVLGHRTFYKKALAQREQVLQLREKRGAIYDRRLQPIALSIEVDSLFACPKEIKDAHYTAGKLASILAEDADTLHKNLSKKEQSFVWIKRRLDKERAGKINALGIKGLYFLKEYKRVYPQNTLAAHLLGFTGIDDQGLEGIERSFQEWLQPPAMKIIVEKDASGEAIQRYVSGEKRIQGYDLALTIDEVIQHIAQQELRAALLKCKAKSASILVINPQSGEILALANEPEFNPNQFSRYPSSSWRNLVITDIFEPGSTFKIVTAAAALEEGLVHVDELFDCENGRFEYKSRVIRDVHKYNTLSFSQVIEYSSNIGTTKVGLRMGEEVLYRYIRAFGFGQDSGLKLKGEVRGLVRPVSQWSKVSLAAIPYGQEIGVTGVQMAFAAAAIANGGLLMQPQIIKSILKKDTQEVVKEFHPLIVRRVVSARTAQTLTQILKGAVERGTGKEAAISGYSLAGKTGTAQKINPQTGSYDEKKFVASFVGYFPADNAEILIFVLIDEPEGQTHGGVVAAPVFKKVAQRIIEYLEIPAEKKEAFPVRERVVKNEIRPDYPVIQIAREENAAGEMVMPDLKGMSLRQALFALQPYDLEIEMKGAGIVFAQSPLPGTKIKSGNKVSLNLEALIKSISLEK